MEYFYIDLDGTLKTDIDFIGGTEKYEDSMGREYPYIIRPYAKEFITGLKEFGKVMIMTLASRPYTDYFMDKIGVNGIIDEIYTREELVMNRLIKNLPTYRLIENDWEIAQQKEKRILLAGGMFVKGETTIVPTYTGGEDGVLEKLLGEIQKEKK